MVPRNSPRDAWITASNNNRPAIVGAVLYRHTQEAGRVVVQPKIRDEVGVREISDRSRPPAGGIYELAVRVDQAEGSGLRPIFQPVGLKLSPRPPGVHLV